MIKEKFLHYQTLKGFQDDLNLYGEESMNDKIAFIKKDKLIWTHGAYYGANDVVHVIPIVTEEIAGLMTPSLYKDLLHIRDIDVPDIYKDIESLQKLISTDSQDITDIIEKFEAIVEFINSLSDDDDSAALLNDIIQRITTVSDNLAAEITRATNKEQHLQDQIDNITSIAEGAGVIGDGVKHVFLTQEEYDSLEEYEENTIYFILEPQENKSWTFGDTFPATFTDSNAIGTFPITLH